MVRRERWIKLLITIVIPLVTKIVIVLVFVLSVFCISASETSGVVYTQKITHIA